MKLTNFARERLPQDSAKMQRTKEFHETSELRSPRLLVMTHIKPVSIATCHRRNSCGARLILLYSSRLSVPWRNLRVRAGRGESGDRASRPEGGGFAACFFDRWLGFWQLLKESRSALPRFRAMVRSGMERPPPRTTAVAGQFLFHFIFSANQAAKDRMPLSNKVRRTRFPFLLSPKTPNDQFCNFAR